jgi:hypothetical protein
MMQRALFAFLVSCLTLNVTWAQELTGVISGVVSDSTGAIVPGASVTIVGAGTGVRAWRGASNKDGVYLAPNLPVAAYDITVELKGFRKVEIRGFDLKVNQRARIDATLQPGDVVESITVSGESVALVEADTSSLGLLVNPNQLRDLPMSGRGLLNLLMLSNGISSGGDATDINQSQISVNGSRTQSLEVNVDGVSLLDGSTGSVGHMPSPEAVREFKLQTSAYSAEYGRTGGATISLVVDSGTNRYRGAVYDYFRNEALNANNFFSNLRGTPRPVTRVNQFGGKFAGPVLFPGLYHGKNRTFFFTNYEGTRGMSPSSPISTIPDMSFRGGDFSASPVAVFDPTNHLQFPGNRIPASRLDPAGQKIVAALPAPNSAGSLAAATGQRANNFVNNTSIHGIYNDVTSRVDHTVGDRGRLFAKLSTYWAVSPVVSTLPGLMDPKQGDMNDGAWTSALGYTHSLTPTLILDARFGMWRKTRNQPPPSLGTDVPSVLGIKRSPMNVVPEINMTGWTDIGGLGNTWSRFAGNIFQYTPTLTWVKGAHSIRVGAQVRRDQYNTFNPGSSYPGSYYFTGGITSSNQATGNAINSLAEMLLGTVTNAIYTSPQPITGRRGYNLGFFVQDDWKVSRNLTVNLGLRQEYEAPLTVSNHMYSRVDVHTGHLLVAGKNASESLNLNPPKVNISPRAGFAYSVNPKTVIRSAFGIFRGQLFSNLGGAVGYPGFAVTQTFGTLGRGVPQAFSLSQGMPFTPPAPYNPLLLEQNATLSNPLVPSTQFADVDHLPVNFQWNFGMQREIMRGTVVEANYVGSHGYHLPLSMRWNTLPSFQIAELETATGTQISTQQYRQFPTVQAANAVFNMGSSTYHALQMRGTRQFSNSLSFQVAYTFAKNLDDGSGLFSNTLPAGAVDHGQLPQYARFLDHAASSMDRKQSLVITPQYTTHFGPKWLRGFSVNPVFTARTGFPYTITQSALFPDVLEQRPNIAGTIDQLYAPQHVTNGTGIQYLRATSDPQFRLSPTGPLFGTVNGKTQMILPAAIGNLARNPVRGPGDVNLNIGIGKRFPLTDRLTFNLRAEAYNALNHTNLNAPATSLAVVASGASAGFNSPGFGLITSARGSRFMQLVARIEF